ncbi:PREDICTED: uncharacterized protein LOC106115685 [Papilio xuthus]|uniref:Uncharacterized protein LOC106115685 n=1 Tax=Papilio xuthus TaxID=66420 RepID=A0AAJ7E655_PAPXU|nr:PREDICTED: uncharacterized protein LOC106115685 [Papilio xuthus]
MAMSNEVQLLKNISTEVDESKLRIFFSIQCSKAQASLLDRLKKKIKERKDILNFITDGNKKLEVEIKLAEQELNNLIIAHNTIKSGNIDIRKELLLKLDENVEFSKRIEAGEKKHEQLWLSSKSRFENIPLVQQCLEGKKRIQIIENNISNLRSKCVGLSDDIKKKKRAAQELTQKYVIDLAKFFVNDRPKIIKMIQDRTNEIQDLIIKTENLQQPMMDRRYSKVKIIELDENSHPEKAMQKNKEFVHTENDAIVMPKLQLMDVDLDILGDKLDQLKKIELNVTPTMENKIKSLGYKIDVAQSSTYNNKWESYYEQTRKSYSDRKLIHIIDDITLNKSQMINIISKVDSNTLQNVNTVGSQKTAELLKICPLPEVKIKQPLKEIEENVDDNEEQHVQSPAQIIDRKKKKVSFDLSVENVQSELTEIDVNVNAEDGINNETLNSQDVSLENVEGNEKLKDKILMAHNLDATPEFVYSKHFISNKMTEDKIIASKFFDGNKVSEPSVMSNHIEEQDNKKQDVQETNFTKPLNMDMLKNNTFETNSKTNQDIQKSKYQISGLLFDHGGSQMMSDLLNVSLNATGFDGDDSYPQCLDSSVLLSPKADVAMDGADNITVMPQLPNFMSGLRKTGSSFFERLTNDNKPNSSTTNTEGNFNFNFSGEEKKKGGGFFNMFFK